MEKKAQSGAEKRKRKRESQKLLKKEISKIPKLSAYFSTSSRSGSTSSTSTSASTLTTEPASESSVESVETTTICTRCDGTEAEGTSLPLCSPTDNANQDKNEELPSSFPLPMDLDNLINKENPTDIANYPEILTKDMKRFILDHGSCRPRGVYPKNDKNRSFSVTYYTTVNKAGLKMERQWLCYSPQLDAVYCEPCWLFSRNAERSRWISKGINDWQNLSTKIKQHEASSSHVEACYNREIWKAKKYLDKNLEDKIAQERNFWRQILERLIKITLKLAKNSSSFRGHRENINETYNGNFLSDVKLLAEYDEPMRRVLSLPSGVTTYLSPQIQNELIQCLGEHLKQELLSEIKEAPFFSIIADTTQDISKKDQLSIICRYVKISRKGDSQDPEITDKPPKFEINETFLGFIALDGQSAADVTSTLLGILKTNNVEITKCRGQGYDGANTMSGIYSGVQARIKEVEPSALYVHCAAHNLNLVVNDVVNDVQRISAYFAIIQSIYIFFGHSINRWDLLSSLTGESVVTLKKLNPTRWAGRLRSLIAIKQRYSDVLKTLTKIVLESKKNDETSEATSIKHNMENFEFIFITIFLEKLLSNINLTSKLLQRKDLDIAQAAGCLEDSHIAVSDLRNHFEVILDEAKAVARTWGTSTEFERKRNRSRKKYYEELAEDHRFGNPSETFKVNVFYQAIDIVITQLQYRFEGLRSIAGLFLFLSPNILLTLPEDELKINALRIQNQYSKDLSESLFNELLLFVKTLRPEIVKISTIRELAELAIVKFYDMTSNYPEVCSLLLLFLTIPVTVATAERSFSKLKIIKNYLRNSMSQKRLSNLALLSIEARRAEQMDVSKLIDVFASAKSRKKIF